MKTAILVVAYNAIDTLGQVLDRIPPAQRSRIAEVVVFDDASVDATYEAGLAYKGRRNDESLTIFRNERNLGYGGNQKRGYTYCIQKGYDAVVLLHGDGQYAPEVMGDLLDALEQENADAVFGSRMMVARAALKGGMPRYKYVGNKILTWIENRLLGTHLSEFHSGYRVYRCSALASVPYDLNTDDFHFDTQIIIQFHERGLKIVERPIPTFYGDEICHVNGCKYAWDVVWAVLRYRLHKLAIIYEPRYDVNPEKYGFHATPTSSHGQILRRVEDGARVLHVGCGSGHVGEKLRERGCEVVGLDRHLLDGARERMDRAFECDIEEPWPAELDGEKFDVVLLADVLEHLRSPEKALAQARAHLGPGGRVIVSVPNAANGLVRMDLLLGRFEYAERGIMDRDHLRFFTKRSLLRALKAAGLRVVATSVTPLPFASIHPPEKAPLLSRAMERIAYEAALAWPGMFAYQHLAVAEIGETNAAQLPDYVSRVEDGDEVEEAQAVEGEEQPRRDVDQAALGGGPQLGETEHDE